MGKSFKQQQQQYQKKQQKQQQHQEETQEQLKQRRMNFINSFVGPLDKNIVAHQKFRPDQFRLIDSRYEYLYWKQLQAYKSVHDGFEYNHNKYTIGYVENIPQYPGTQIDVLHPFYPRCLGQLIENQEDYKLLNRPIITIRDEKDLNQFIQIFEPDEDAIKQFNEQLNDQKEIWFLPDSRVLFCIRYTDNIQDAILQNQSKQEIQKAKEELQGDNKNKQVKKISIDELYSKIKKIFLLVCLVILIIVSGYIYISSKYLNNQIGGTNLRKLYQTLNLSETATRKQVQKAFKKLSIQYHPDRNPNCTDCYEKFQKINNAYQKIIKYLDVQEGKGNIN